MYCSGAGVWQASKTPSRLFADEDARPHRHTLIAVFVAFSLLLPLFGIGIYRFHGPQAEHEALANLRPSPSRRACR